MTGPSTPASRPTSMAATTAATAVVVRRTVPPFRHSGREGDIVSQRRGPAVALRADDRAGPAGAYPGAMPSTPVPPLVVGFDLDMTLIDTVPGFRAVLTALGAELGVEFPVAEMTARLGPPLDHL